MKRFWIADIVGFIAIAGYYDVPAGDYVGDRTFVACVLLLVALTFPGEL